VVFGFSVVILAASCAQRVESPLTGDAAIFLAMGRGLLNGLVLYRDMFETKPPGIFLTSALSLAFGGTALAKGLTVAGYICLSVGAWRWQRDVRGLAIGVLVATYLHTQTGGYLTEGLGALALCGYVATLDGRPGRVRTSLAASALGVAVLFKEPFLLIGLAIAVIGLKSRREFFTDYLVPQILGLLGVGLMLWTLGVLEEYVTSYLPFMLRVRVGSDTWWQTIHLWAVIKNVGQFSLPLLALASHAIWCRRSVRALVGLLIVTYAAGLGGFDRNHVAMIGPVLFLLMVDDDRPASDLLLIASLVVLAITFVPQVMPRAEQIQEERAVAAKLDGLLDRCDVGRYLYLGSPSNVYGYTRHSPLGPMIFLNAYFLQEPRLVGPLFANLQQADVVLVHKVGTRRPNPLEQQIYELAAPILRSQYSPSPPDCAVGGIDTENFLALFRVSR